ncbi:MAG: T9SS type A sorting domain-containing protein [Cruoricaptor ignavus]|nr:T9SS type A sorting domain-containing protein [Cruoricaptor ignavus]
MKKIYSLFAAVVMAVAVNAQTEVKTVNYVFANAGFSNGQAISEAVIDDKITLTTEAKDVAQSPTYYTTGAALRVYSNRNSGDGNEVTLTPVAGTKITSLTINALNNYRPTVTYSVDGGSFQQATLAEGVYTISGLEAATSLTFKNAHQGGSSNTQLRMTSLDITYETTLSVADINVAKKTLVKNTQVTNELVFAAKSDVKVINMNGQVVKSVSVNENTSVNVSELPKGVYIVTGNVAGQAVSQKVIKK